jgi:hypothetical protein
MPRSSGSARRPSRTASLSCWITRSSAPRPEILRRTREAIHAGDVVADFDAENPADLAALRSLGAALHLTGAATDVQALALWALYRNGYAASGDLPDKLVTRLSELHLGSLVSGKRFADPGAPTSEAINAALDRLSPEIRAQLEHDAHAFDVSTAHFDQVRASIARHAPLGPLAAADFAAALERDRLENVERDDLIRNFALSSGTRTRVRLRVQ